MLQITIPPFDGWSDSRGKFVTSDGCVLQLEHSLVSLSKWESKWEIPFLSADKTSEQALDYVRMMILGEFPPEEDFSRLSAESLEEIKNYINAKMTATTFSDRNSRKGKEIITAEIIYYWMISLGIPFECQYWHLNRLLALIRVCNTMNSPKKKMSRAEASARQRELNDLRRRQTGSRG